MTEKNKRLREIDPTDPNLPSALPAAGDKRITGEEPASQQWQAETQERIAAAIQSADALVSGEGMETPRETALRLENEHLKAILAQTESAQSGLSTADDDSPVSPSTPEEKPSTPEEKARVTLAAAGFDTPEKLQAASDDDLLKLPGVTKSGLAAVRATALTST